MVRPIDGAVEILAMFGTHSNAPSRRRYVPAADGVPDAPAGARRARTNVGVQPHGAWTSLVDHAVSVVYERRCRESKQTGESLFKFNGLDAVTRALCLYMALSASRLDLSRFLAVRRTRRRGR